MRVEEKLGVDKFNVDDGNPHILIRDDPGPEVLDRLIKACPAGLYHRTDAGTVRFDYEGCLECGTCRVLGLGNVVTSWNYPLGGMGVEFRYG